jgi:heme/copper-type cytochrome/quinol oxidase subunit 3
MREIAMAQEVASGVIEPTEDAAEELSTLIGGPPSDVEPPDGPDDGDPFGGGGDDDDDGRHRSPIHNARLGMLMFLGAETMFFAGLIGSFLLFRVANQVWPPPMFPRLPVVITLINTLFLLYSAVTMWQARQAMRQGLQTRSVTFLLYTTVLGVVFLGIQGYEWTRLIQVGLTLTSGVYGATFYILIGAHALHVLGAVIWLMVVLLRTWKGYYRRGQDMGMAVCSMYWFYVVGLWPVLYWLVYLY